MDYTKSNMLHIDLNEIYEAELHNLVQENEVLRVQNGSLKLQLRTENKQRQALQYEFKQMKKTYENNDSSMVLCSMKALCKGLDMVKKKHTYEIETICQELSKSKQKLENINKTIHRERSLRSQTEADKLEAIKIAEELFRIIEQLQKNILESTLNTQALKPLQPFVQDITEEQKKLKKEHLLKDLYNLMEEQHDPSEIKKHISTTEPSMGSLKYQPIQHQPQLQRGAELKTEEAYVQKLGESHISRKLHFLHRYI